MVACAAAQAAWVVPAGAAPSVVISQVFGGGGETFGFPNADYVELFNRGDQPQDLSGWSLQVSQGSDLAPWMVIPLVGEIGPGQFYLVQVYSPASAQGVRLPQPDVVGTNHNSALLLATDGRVALVRNTAPLGNTPCPAFVPVNIADFVAWGPEYACAEAGLPAPQTDAVDALFRAEFGCQDANNNEDDFFVDTPAPRNSRDNGFIETAANPGNPMQGSNVTILVQRDPVAPCSLNLGSIVSATADLSAIGGPADFLLDDAGGDDDLPGDGLFGGTARVGNDVPVGTYFVPVTVGDGVRTISETIAITVRAAPPVNDYCPGALDIGTLATPFTITADNSTAEPDINPICGTAFRPFGLWYRFTPEFDGVLRMRETGPQDVLYGVYQTPGCILSGISGLAMCSGTDDPTMVSVIGGESYVILVSSADTSASPVPPTAPLELSFAFVPRPANDECINATDLGALAEPYSETIDNSTALVDIDLSCNNGTVTRFGVWYTFVPAAAGALVIAETSSQDAVFGVFTGACGALAQLPSGSCYATDNPSIVIPLAAGTRYFILAGNQTSSTSPPTAPLDLTITFAPFPSNDSCAAARVVTQFPFDDYPYGPQAGDDLPDVACNAAANTVTRRGVWYRIPPSPSSGRLILTERSSNDVVFAVFDGDSCTPLGPQVCLTEAAAASGVSIAAGHEYRVLVGLNSASFLPSLPYALRFDFDTLTGACCLGSTCRAVTGGDCAAVGGAYMGLHTVCNVFGVENASPCCFTDYNQSGLISVQDIFDFLAGYAAGDPGADVNGRDGVSVQDIFDYLFLFFGSGCP